jgi:Arc/MetJ family transcription regulator
MKTTIDIPDNMLAEAMKYSKAATKREAVLAALEEFNRRRRQAKLVEHFGTFKDFMTPQELKRMRSMD